MTTGWEFTSFLVVKRKIAELGHLLFRDNMGAYIDDE